MSLVAYGDSDSDSEGSPTPAPQPGPTQDVRKLLSVLPPAKRAPGSKGRVRIGLPKLDKGNNSDDSDDELPAIKRRKQGGGLTALLPQPKGITKPSPSAPAPKLVPPTTRNMVPYTLSKRYQDSRTKAKKKSKLVPKKKENDNSDSDSDGEPVSFFSHLDSPAANPSVSTPQSDSKVVEPESNFGLVSVSQSAPTSEIGPSYITSAPTAPKPFNVHGPPSSEEHVPAYIDGYQTYGEVTTSIPTEEDHQLAQSSDWYPGQYDSAQSYSYQGGEEETAKMQQHGPMPGPGPGLSIDDEAFRRLAGGKRRRNRMENLNDIIDINEEEVKDGIKTYQKYHSEEAVDKLYQVDPNKVAQPTSDQKRKHQLHWLAYQAKANELQLLKQWSQSASTKRQTQQKYGF